MSVISYLETATKIRRVMIKNYSFDFSADDIASLSLFLSLYYYEDSTKIGDTNIIEKNILQSYLEEQNASIENVLKVLKLEQDDFHKLLSSSTKNVYAIEYYYRKYYKDITETDITVITILENLLDRNLSKSVEVERLLQRLGIQLNDILSIGAKIDKIVELEEQKYKNFYISNFYDRLAKETKDYIEFTTKVYLLILQKMKDKKHNKEILVGEDDADTLALYIAIYYFRGNVAKFFEFHGVTLDKILELLQLNITKDEIEAITLPDKKIIVDRYHRFVYSGVNENKEEITIDDIATNLCNRKFNQSMIMENIFNELTDDISLKSDFEKQLNEYFVNQKGKKLLELTNELFLDMPVESIEYLERVFKIHHFLDENRSIKNDDDIKVISLLLGILLEKKYEHIRGFYQTRGFESIENVLEYLRLRYLNYDVNIEKLENSLLLSDVDLELLKQEYYDFIFSGYNTGLSKNSLRIYQISKNIFNRNLYNSVYISKLLRHFNQSYDEYENIDELYNIYIDEEYKSMKEEIGKQRIEKYQNKSVTLYMELILKIHKQLNHRSDLKISIQSQDDIAVLSFIIGLLSFPVETGIDVFFKKYGINLDNLLKVSGLSSEFNKNIENEKEIDYTLIDDVYGKYLERVNIDAEVSDIIVLLFDKQINSTTILEQLTSYYGIDYNILKTEVISKIDYESTLTISERIELLGRQHVGELDSDSMESILHFGESLALHSRYIHDELPKIILSDVHEESVSTINRIISKIYKKEEEKPKGLLSRIFKFTFALEEAKLVLDPVAVEELKTAIDTNIKKLSNELLGYDAIRKYIEVYYRKNYAHYMVAQSEIKKLENKVGELNPEDDESYIEFLEANSHLQIMRDKTNRFKTSSQLMKQELAKVNTAIVTHFITINALEMARDDLLPLIGSELALSKGLDTESSSLELSQSVIELFQSMLERNADKAVFNMEKLKNSNLPSNIMELLNKDIELYLSGIEKVSELDEQSSTINPLLTGSTIINDDKAKQKIYEIRYNKHEDE